MCIRDSRVLRPQLRDHRVPLRQRRHDHRELLTQLTDSSGLLGHRAIININSRRSSRHAATDLTSYDGSTPTGHRYRGVSRFEDRRARGLAPGRQVKVDASLGREPFMNASTEPAERRPLGQ